MTIGIAVIGAGMAGRAHAAAYRSAPTLYASTLPPLRYVSIGDVSPEFGALAAQRFGYERSDTSWQAIAENPDIDVVSVVVANSLHREMVEGLIDAGKHVLCEKPLSDNLDDARAMAETARRANTVVRIGFTFRRAPGVAALRDLVLSSTLGRVLHVDVRYWCDYASDPDGPISWRYKGAPGSGALADIGSHASYLAEFLAGNITEVSGGRFTTAIAERPVPLGAVIGHGQAAVSEKREPVENDDYAAFSARCENGVGVVQVSRVAAGHPNGLAIEVFGDHGAAKWEQERSGEFQLMLNEGPAGQRGYRRVIIGPEHPYFAGGLPMDAPGVNLGQNEGFAFQARAFLDEVAGLDETHSLPRCASFDEGVHNMEVLAAVTESAARGGAAVEVPPLHVSTLGDATPAEASTDETQLQGAVR
jgi:predicted dehydrogenase